MPSVFGRRVFVRLALALGGGAFALAIGFRQYTRAQNRAVLRLAGWLADSEDVRILGRTYLAAQPHEAEAIVLVELLGTDLGLTRYGPSEAELHELFRCRTRRDFEDGNTVTVQGWILSRTELRLCALAAVCPRTSLCRRQR